MDREGYDEFFAAHYDDVVRTLTLAFGDRDRAEDAAQEAFARAYRRWAQVARMERPAGWVVVVATNQLRRWFVRRERREHPVGDGGLSTGTTGADHGDAVAAATSLHDALDRLPTRQRATVVLRYLCDLPTNDVAKALGCAPGTVKSALSAGLASLRISLDDTELDTELDTKLDTGLDPEDQGGVDHATR